MHCSGLDAPASGVVQLGPQGCRPSARVQYAPTGHGTHSKRLVSDGVQPSAQRVVLHVPGIAYT